MLVERRLSLFLFFSGIFFLFVVLYGDVILSRFELLDGASGDRK